MGITFSTGTPLSQKQLDIVNQRNNEKQRVATDVTKAYQAYERCRLDHPFSYPFNCWQFKHQIKFSTFEWHRLNEEYKMIVKSNHLTVQPVEPK